MALVLVCDDYPEVRQLLVEILSPHGLEVITAGNGEDALSIAKSIHPSLIISDVVMPKLNGINLVRAIRQDSELADTPCILMSSPDWAEPAGKSGCDVFIAKPFDLAHVQIVVARLLNGDRDID